jgi:hypothetical protein
MNQEEIINYNLLKGTLRNLVGKFINFRQEDIEDEYYLRLNRVNIYQGPRFWHLIFDFMKPDSNLELPYLKRLELENRSISELQKLLVTESILKELE